MGQNGQILAVRHCGSNTAGLWAGSELVPVGGSGGQGTGGSGGQGAGVSVKRQPVGELFNVNLELAGLKGQPVSLSWQIFQKAGRSHLSGEWLGNFAAYSLEATTNDDTGSLVVWVPMPRQPGPYFIRLSLTSGDESLAGMDSGPFD